MSCAEAVIGKEQMSNVMMVFVGFITVDLSFCIKHISPSDILITDERNEPGY